MAGLGEETQKGSSIPEQAEPAAKPGNYPPSGSKLRSWPGEGRN